jgi:hypothetical protein
MQLWKGMSIDWCEELRENLFEAVRKKSQVVFVTSEWVCVYSWMRYIYNAIDWWVPWGTVDWLGNPTFTHPAIELVMLILYRILCRWIDHCDVGKRVCVTAVCCEAVAFIKIQCDLVDCCEMWNRTTCGWSTSSKNVLCSLIECRECRITSRVEIK